MNSKKFEIGDEKAKQNNQPVSKDAF